MNAEELLLLQTAEAQDFIHHHLNDRDLSTLALRSRSHEHIPLRACIEQIACRQKAAGKFPALHSTGWLFHPQAMQQASSEATAWLKSTWLSGSQCIDMTGGMGIDTMYLAQTFERVTWIDQNVILYNLFNFNLLNSNIPSITTFCDDCLAYIRRCRNYEFDWMYCDPSRRTERGRIVDLAACIPDITTCESMLLTKARRVCIKAAPAYDLSAAQKTFDNLSEIKVISLDGEVKEVLLILDPASHIPGTAPLISAHLLGTANGKIVSNSSFQRTYEDLEKSDHHKPGRYLFVPDAAIIKADLVDLVAGRFHCHRLSRTSVYLSGDCHDPTFPGRIYEIRTTLSGSMSSVQKYCRHNRIQAASIARRDYPLSPERIRAELKLDESQHDFFFFTRDHTGERLCLHAQPPARPD